MRHSNHTVPSGEDEQRDVALPNTQPHQIAYGQEAPFSVFGLVPSFSALGQPVNTEGAETQARVISYQNRCKHYKNLILVFFF